MCYQKKYFVKSICGILLAYVQLSAVKKISILYINIILKEKEKLQLPLNLITLLLFLAKNMHFYAFFNHFTHN